MDAEELIPYQIKLNHITKSERDGKYFDPDDESIIPEGQAIITELIDEVHEMMASLRR